jgi:hypothetical protein
MAKRGRSGGRSGKPSRRSTPRASRPRHKSPSQLFRDAAPPVRCFWSKHREELRQCSVLVFRDLPDGRHAMAGFLVDLGCAGLKDAWGEMDVEADDFIYGFLTGIADEMDVEVAAPADALRLVRGAARFAADCGFRLPKDWEPWAALIGNVGDWRADADLSEFGLEFGGTLSDLRRRYVGGDVDAFLAREDVAFTIGPEGAYEPALSDDQLAYEEGMARVAAAIADHARQWCFARGVQPNPRLGEAASLLFLASTSAMDQAAEDEIDVMASPDLDAVPDETGERMARSLKDFIALRPPAEQAELREAVVQFQSYLGENPDAFLRLMTEVGMADDDDDDEEGETDPPQKRRK